MDYAAISDDGKRFGKETKINKKYYFIVSEFQSLLQIL